VKRNDAVFRDRSETQMVEYGTRMRNERDALQRRLDSLSVVACPACEGSEGDCPNCEGDGDGCDPCAQTGQCPGCAGSGATLSIELYCEACHDLHRVTMLEIEWLVYALEAMQREDLAVSRPAPDEATCLNDVVSLARDPEGYLEHTDVLMGCRVALQHRPTFETVKVSGDIL
jgi:hypothetical protein